jgi:hypothetical protein
MIRKSVAVGYKVPCKMSKEKIEAEEQVKKNIPDLFSTLYMRPMPESFQV